MDDDRRSVGGDEPPLFDLPLDTPGEIGGDDVPVGFER